MYKSEASLPCFPGGQTFFCGYPHRRRPGIGAEAAVLPGNAYLCIGQTANHYGKTVCLGYRRRRVHRLAYGRRADRGGIRRGHCGRSFEQRPARRRGRAPHHGGRGAFRAGRLLRSGGARTPLPPVPFRFGNPLRGVESRRRVGARTPQILPQQPDVVSERRGADARHGAAQHRLFVVVHGLRRGRRAARDRTHAAQARHVALRQYEADVRGRAARRSGGLRGAARHRAPLLQPDRGASLGADRRAAAGRAAEPRALRHADRGRHPRMPLDLRRRLPHARRIEHPRLHRRHGPRTRPRSGHTPHVRRGAARRL